MRGPDIIIVRLMRARGLGTQSLTGGIVGIGTGSQNRDGLTPAEIRAMLSRREPLPGRKQQVVARLLQVEPSEIFDRDGLALLAPPEPPKRKPGKLLRHSLLEHMRHARSVPPEALAELVACTVKDWERLEQMTGPHPTTETQRRDIAQMLGAEVSELWTDEGWLVRRGQVYYRGRPVMDAKPEVIKSHMLVVRCAHRPPGASAVAKAVGIPIEEYERIEAGTQLADPVTAEKIADYFGKTLPELFSTTLLAIPADVEPLPGPTFAERTSSGAIRRFGPVKYTRGRHGALQGHDTVTIEQPGAAK